MTIGERLKALRRQNGMTQEKLAEYLCVSYQAVSKWETSETYPDGALLVPIANALDVSLDVLFDNKAYSMRDISTRIRNLISDTPADKQFHLVRDICWQIEKGLFNCCMAIEDSYSPDEINRRTKSSYILNDYGFTHVSNGCAPFFSVFPEYGDNLSDVIGNGEEMRKIFAALASPETMRALLFLFKKEANYVFEAEVLSELGEIPLECIDDVIKDLDTLHVVYMKDLEIDGKLCTLYYARPQHLIIALMLFAHELNYRDGYCLQSHYRNKPHLK